MHGRQCWRVSLLFFELSISTIPSSSSVRNQTTLINMKINEMSHFSTFNHCFVAIVRVITNVASAQLLSCHNFMSIVHAQRDQICPRAVWHEVGIVFLRFIFKLFPLGFHARSRKIEDYVSGHQPMGRHRTKKQHTAILLPTRNNFPHDFQTKFHVILFRSTVFKHLLSAGGQQNSPHAVMENEA